MALNDFRTPKDKLVIRDEIIKSMCDDVHKQDIVKTACVPFSTLGKEIIDRLPSVDGEILLLSDVGLLVALWKRLRDEGKDASQMTCVVHTIEQEEFIKQFPVKKIINVGYNNPINELEKQLMGLKFDIIVGNPPYQAGSSGQKLWNKFYMRGFSYLAEGGTISFLTPSSFLLRTGKSMDKLRNEFLKRQVTVINFDANDSFSVGESVVWTEVLNLPSNDSPTLVTSAGRISKQTFSDELRPWVDETHKLEMSIMRKMEQSTHNRFDWREDVHDGQAHRVRIGDFSEVQTDEYKYPVIYTPNTTHYARELFKDGDALRLMVTLAGTYYSEKSPDRNIFISRSHSGQGMLHLLIDSEGEGLEIKRLLISKPYRFFIQSEKTSGYNTGLPKLPHLDTSRQWTDEELYAHFNLTQEEIDLIEATVK